VDGRTRARLRGSGTPANFTVSRTTLRHDHDHDTTRHDTSGEHDSRDQAPAREASATSRSPRYYTWLAALLFRSSPAPLLVLVLLPLHHLLVRRLRLLGRFLRSRRANDSPPRSLRVHQAAEPGSSRSALTAQLDGVRRRLTTTAGTFCLPRWRPRSVPTVPTAAPRHTAPARPTNRERPPPALGGRCDVIATRRNRDSKIEKSDVRSFESTAVSYH